MMKKLFSLVFLLAVFGIFNQSSAFSFSDFPKCEKTLSGSVVCATASGYVVPEDTLVIVKDFCPDGDTSPSSFDQECSLSTGSDVIQYVSGSSVPFGSVAKYLNLTESLEQSYFYENGDSANTIASGNAATTSQTQETSISQKFLATGANEQEYSIAMVALVLVLLGYFSVGFVVFKE